MNQATVVGMVASVSIAGICGGDHAMMLRCRRLKHVLASNLLVQTADVMQAHVCASACCGADMVDCRGTVDASLRLLTLFEGLDLLHLD